MKLEFNFSEWLLFEGKNPIRQGEIEIYGDTYNKKEDIKRVTHGQARYSGEKTWYVPADYRRAILALGGLMVTGDPTSQQAPRPQLRPTQAARPQLKQAQPEPATLQASVQPPEWIYAKVAKSDKRFPEGKEIAVRPIRDDKSVWEYVVLDPRFSRRFGEIKQEEIKSGLIKSVRLGPDGKISETGKPIYTAKPNFKEYKNKLGIMEPKPSKSKVLSQEQLSEEQLKIDKKFESILRGDKQNHMMINALAGTGKTTTLKHLAWKYGSPDQSWLYLVFNTKNRVEASEEFPSFVAVRTTNGFLGEVLEGRAPGTQANKTKVPQTQRIIALAELKKKGEEDDEGGGKLEKARLIADGAEFAALMESYGIPNKFDASEYEGITAKTLNSLMRSIKYNFKEQVLTLVGLAKSYAIDPRKPDKLESGLKYILDEYDFDTTLEEVKERINKYKGYFKNVIRQALQDIMGYDFMSKNFAEEIKTMTIWMLNQSMPTITKQKYQKGGFDHDLGEFRDFTDDLWHASTFADELVWPKYDIVLADEVQDFNESQKVMLQKLSEQGAKIVAVGDPNQAIYRFRGADSEAFSNLEKALTSWSHDKDGVVHSLSENFRSKQAILDKSNSETHVKNLKGSPRKKYDEEGHVTHGHHPDPEHDARSYDAAFAQMKKEMDITGEVKQTAFISRTNEPLVHAALRLLTLKIPFQIVGKDIAKDLRSHIRKVSNMTGTREDVNVEEFADKLREFLDKETETHHGKATRKVYLQELKEATEAILACIEQYTKEAGGGDINGFKKWIGQRLGGLDIEENERDFKKYRERVEKENPVILTTAHRSKGLEFSRVYILRYDLFPHKKAKRPKDKLQEENMKYVGITRAQDELHILNLEDQPGFKKPSSFEEWSEWCRHRDLLRPSF